MESDKQANKSGDPFAAFEFEPHRKEMAEERAKCGRKRWISAGHTVPLEASKFERVGEYDGFPVYRRSGESENVIYLPAREGAIAPYRLKP